MARTMLRARLARPLTYLKGLLSGGAVTTPTIGPSDIVANRQRQLTPSCGGIAPTAERTVGPARMIVGELDTRTRN
jgi:hypothetical protein